MKKWAVWSWTVTFLPVIAIVLLMIIPSFASATGQIVFTTTSDFNTGNKTDPGQTYFASNGIDQPSNWEAKPRAIFDSVSGNLFTVWQGTRDYNIYIASWNQGTNLWSGPYVVNTVPNPSVGDGHGSPAVAISADGFLHVFCCGHATNLLHFKSSNARDATSWTRLSDFAFQSTYPNVFVLANGTMYVFYRLGFSHSSALVYALSLDNGNTFLSNHVIVDFRAETKGLYFGNIEPNPDGISVSFAYMWDKGPAGDRHDLYYARLDLTTNHIFSISGVDIGTSVNLAGSNTSLRIYTTFPLQTFYPSLHFYNGNPFIIYLVERISNGDVNVNWTQWNGASWTATSRIFNTASANNMGDFRVINTTAIAAYYPWSFGDITGGGVLYEWNFDGVTWTKGKIIMGSQWSHAPMVTNGAPLIVFDEREPGIDNQFGSGINNEFSRLWAWNYNTKTVLTRSDIPSGTYGVETSSDNQFIPSGSFQLASPNNDVFNLAKSDGRTFKWDMMNYTGYGHCNVAIGRSIINNGMRLSVQSTDGLACASGSITSANFTGNWNTTIQLTRIQNGSTGQWEYSMLNQPGYCSTTFPTIRGIYFFAQTGNVQVYHCVNGSPIFIAWITGVFPAHIWIRLTRSINTFSGSYSTDGISFTPIGSFSDTLTPNAMWPVISEYSGNVADVITGVWNNFVIDSPVSQSGVRETGKWVSLTQAFNNEVIKSVVIGYSGASPSLYIESVSIISSDGQLLYGDFTHRTSGTTATITIPDESLVSLDGFDWKIQVVLHGDGISTMIVNDITVNTVRSLFSIATQDAPWLLGFFALLTLGLVGAFAIKRKRGH